MNGLPWTKGQDLHLIDWVNRHGLEEAARKLGRTENACVIRLRKIELEKGNESKQ